MGIFSWRRTFTYLLPCVVTSSYIYVVGCIKINGTAIEVLIPLGYCSMVGDPDVNNTRVRLIVHILIAEPKSMKEASTTHRSLFVYSPHPIFYLSYLYHSPYLADPSPSSPCAPPPLLSY